MWTAIFQIIKSLVGWFLDPERMERERHERSEAEIEETRAWHRNAILDGDELAASEYHAELIRLLKRQRARSANGK